MAVSQMEGHIEQNLISLDKATKQVSLIGRYFVARCSKIVRVDASQSECPRFAFRRNSAFMIF